VTAIASYRSPLGPITVEVTDRGVCGVVLRPGGIAAPALAHARPPLTSAQHRHLEDGLGALRDYFLGRPPRLPRFDLRGSPFSRRVWRALLEIPWGDTCTYGEIAAAVDAPRAARAVGGASARNPVVILVPCHRVVAADGLGGYSGGLDVKRWLLAHEAGHAPALRPAAPARSEAGRRGRRRP
jgi:methylated-DNA-[protein]-cysteine S-methyltransferase